MEEVERPMTVGELSEGLMWAAIIAAIGGGFLLGLDPRACGMVLLAIVAGLYWWGRPSRRERN